MKMADGNTPEIDSQKTILSGLSDGESSSTRKDASPATKAFGKFYLGLADLNELVDEVIWNGKHEGTQCSYIGKKFVDYQKEVTRYELQFKERIKELDDAINEYEEIRKKEKKEYEEEEDLEEEPAPIARQRKFSYFEPDPKKKIIDEKTVFETLKQGNTNITSCIWQLTDQIDGNYSAPIEIELHNLKNRCNRMIARLEKIGKKIENGIAEQKRLEFAERFAYYD